MLETRVKLAYASLRREQYVGERAERQKNV